MNNASPFVSVIIPNYNYARYLQERLDSIISQTYQFFEIIILDDKSTDNSKEIIEQYRFNPHVSHIVYNEENSGSTFIQWYKGFSLAKGELIWIAESDDTCEPVLLERLVSEFVKDNELVLAFSLTRLFRDDGWVFDVPALDRMSVTKVNGHKFIRRYMADGCYVTNASSALFRKDTALSIDDQYTKYKSCGDHLFWIEISEKGNVAIINERLNYCRRHGSNVTDKNTLNGVRQREGKMIMDYLVSKGLLNKWEQIKNTSLYVYGTIYRQKFIDDNLKRYLLEVWDVGPIIRIGVLILSIRTIFSSIKNRTVCLYHNSVKGVCA